MQGKFPVLKNKLRKSLGEKSAVPENHLCTLLKEKMSKFADIVFEEQLEQKGKPNSRNGSTEGNVTFDIIFDAILLTNCEQIKIIVKIEVNKTTQNPLKLRKIRFTGWKWKIWSPIIAIE